MAEDKDSKTEDPTSKRLSKARSDGNIPVSQEVKSVAMLLAALIMVGVLAPWVARGLTNYMRMFNERPESMPVDVATFRTFVVGILVNVGYLMAFPMFVLVVAAFAGSMGQVGLVYTPKKIGFKLSNLSPISGFNRMFSMTSVVVAGKGIAKMITVGLLIGLLVVPTMSHPDKLIGQSILATLAELHRVIVIILFLVVRVMVALATADFV